MIQVGWQGWGLQGAKVGDRAMIRDYTDSSSMAATASLSRPAADPVLLQLPAWVSVVFLP